MKNPFLPTAILFLILFLSLGTLNAQLSVNSMQRVNFVYSKDHGWVESNTIEVNVTYFVFDEAFTTVKITENFESKEYRIIENQLDTKAKEKGTERYIITIMDEKDKKSLLAMDITYKQMKLVNPEATVMAVYPITKSWIRDE